MEKGGIPKGLGRRETNEWIGKNCFTFLRNRLNR